MRTSRKPGKITPMRKGQEGMASILVVSVLIVIITLISIGFARIMNRSLANSTNRQSSAAATYVAQSGINDVADYIKTHPTAYSSSCNNSPADPTSPSLIGNSTSPGPFYNDANNVGGAGSTAKYTCILLNQFPQDLLYQQVAANKTRVTRVNTTAFSGFLGKIMLSWQSSISQNNGYPTSSSSLNTQTNWNTASSGICQQGGTAAGCVPILKVSLYPVPVGGDLSQVQAKSKTVYLYPQSGVGNMPHPSYSSLNDGSLMPVTCSSSIGNDASGNPYFNGSTNYACNIIVQDLDKIYLSPAQIDYVYMKITPIYGQADVRIEANDAFRQVVNFKYTQAMIDVTGTYGGVAKRLQARVDTSTFTDTAGVYKEDDNLGSNSDLAPDQALRTAVAICKRAVVISDPAYSYIAFDSPATVCHDSDSGGGAGSGSVPLPNPQLTMDAQGVSYSADSPAAPYKGVYYLPNGVNSATINWQSKDATDCTAQAPSVGWGTPSVTSGWSGSQKAYMSFSGTGNTTGNGSRPVSIDTDQVTSFGLQCSRVSLPSNVSSPARTVTLWPYPTANASGPSSVEAGQNYTVSWSSTGAVRCSLSGPWTDTSQTGTSGSQTMNWPWNDTSTKTFTVTCYDPAGRASTGASRASGPSGSSTATVGPTQPDCVSCGHVHPPQCDATASLVDNGNGTGGFFWNGNCPTVSPGDGNYTVNSNIPGVGSGNIPASSRNYMGTLSPGSYNLQLIACVPVWGNCADSTVKTVVIYPPVRITYFHGNQVWDQGPVPCAAGTGQVGNWYCRNDRNTVNMFGPGCPDGVHRFTMCGSDLQWTASGGDGAISCNAYTTMYGGSFASGGGDRSTGGTPYSLGWPDGGNPEPGIYLVCRDGRGVSDQSGPPPG